MLSPDRYCEARSGRYGYPSLLDWRVAIEGSMYAPAIVVIAELVRLAGEINRVLEKDVVKILTTDRADQPFDKRM